MAINQIIYTNGILTDYKGSQETAQEISRLTGIETEIIHNESTPLETAGKISALVANGIIHFAAHLLGSEQAKNAAYQSIQKAICVWSDIQVKKEDCAKSLASRVSMYLEENKGESILLVFHSQGTHVGMKALYDLQDYKDRIHVVALGGMVRIPENLAETVVNFAHSDDVVSNYVAPVVGPYGERIDIGGGGHSAISYLNNPSFINYLLSNGVIEEKALIGQDRSFVLESQPSLPLQVC